MKIKVDFEKTFIYCFFESIVFFVILSGLIGKDMLIISYEIYFLVYCPFCSLVVNILILFTENSIKSYEKERSTKNLYQ